MNLALSHNVHAQLQLKQNSAEHRRYLKLARYFMQWLVEDVITDNPENSRMVNNCMGLIYAVKEGYLLVCPDLFQHFDNPLWDETQRALRLLGLVRYRGALHDDIFYYKDAKTDREFKGMVLPYECHYFLNMRSKPVLSDLVLLAR